MKRQRTYAIYIIGLMSSFLFMMGGGFASAATILSTSFVGCSADQPTPSDAWACGTNNTVFSSTNGPGACTSNGYQGVYAAANYPGGAGGRGWRKWVCAGTSSSTGIMRLGLGSTVPEFWIRFYTRWQPGFEWNSSNGLYFQKVIYLYGGSAASIMDLIHADTWSLTTSYGGGTGKGGGQAPANCSACGWNTINPNGAMQANGVRLGDGSWHSIEAHFKDQTGSGTYDGIWDVWIDGQLKSHVTGINYYSGAPQGFDNLSIMINQIAPSNPTPMYNDIDDIAISTTGYIGPIGGAAPATPSPPTNVR